jgi:hypothetical protein
MGSGCIDPHFHDLGTSWRWVVIFTPRPLYPRGKIPGTHLIGGWVDVRTDLDDLEKIKFLALPGLELRPLYRPARSLSLYRRSYPGSEETEVLGEILPQCHIVHNKSYIIWPGLEHSSITSVSTCIVSVNTMHTCDTHQRRGSVR